MGKKRSEINLVTKSKTLQLVFLNGDDKKVTLALPDAADHLTSVEVKTAMKTIAEADAFAKDGVDGVDVYKIPKSASYVERVVTNLFDDSAGNSKRATTVQAHN